VKGSEFDVCALAPAVVSSSTAIPIHFFILVSYGCTLIVPVPESVPVPEIGKNPVPETGALSGLVTVLLVTLTFAFLRP
jgi:hypothetical protein